MSTRFVASQSVDLDVGEQLVPIHHYLRQPQRLVNALTDTSRIEQLNEHRFRLKMRPLAFMNFTLQPTVDMEVWTEANGTVHLRSVGCEIRGIEYINQRFKLNLVGQLAPAIAHGRTHLKGLANLEVQVDLPMPLSFTPAPILEMAGNGLLHSVLLTIKQRLSHQLLADYRHWVAAQTAEQATTPVFTDVSSPELI